MKLEPGRSLFGTLPNGEPVEMITLASPGAPGVRLLTYGASIHSVLVPNRHGVLGDVALGHATLTPYLEQPQYLGSTVGRVANRIAGGRFTLDGRPHQVPVNNGPNSLHGGAQGFDKRVWEVLASEERRAVLRLISPDGDQGYPGQLTILATYAIHPDQSLSVEYLATADRPTLANLSNHTYWNLAGEGAGDAMDHLLTIPADAYLPTDGSAIPTGAFRPVAGSPFDFRRPRRIGDRVRDGSDEQIRYGRGYDHNWVVAREAAATLRLLARVEDSRSGRAMDILSNQPGIQFYSGNFLDGTTIGKSGQLYRMGDAIVLEPQMFPDAPNRPEFASIRLAPGQTYRNEIVWRFTASG